MSKKIFSVLLSLALLISLIPMSSAYAAGGTCEFSIIPDAAEVERGDTINFAVKVEQTGQLAGIEVKLAAIPEGLTFVSGTVDDNAEEALGFADLSWTKSSKKLTGYYDDEPFAGTDEVTLMTFQCTVDDDAEYKEYEIAFAEDTLFASDENGEPKATTQIVAKVTVVPTPVAVTGVEIEESLTLDIGEKDTPEYTVNPADATNKAVSFSSSNPEVAAVDAETGEVEGKAEGTVTITVTTVDGGFTDTCAVTVACDHIYGEYAEEDYLVSGADCMNAPVYHKSCGKCGAEGTETFSEGTALGHAYTEKIADAAHLKTASANCQTAAEYWYDCTRCDANAKDDAEAADKWYESEEFAGHNFAGEWHKDAEGHWYECQTAGCTAKDTKLDHNPSDNGGNCAIAVVCTDCGWEITEAGEHNFTGEWQKDENGHWKVCACGVADTAQDHEGNYDSDCSTAVVCDKCQYVIEPAQEHNRTGEWHYTEEGHYRDCVNDCKAEPETLDPHDTIVDDGDCTTPVVCQCGFELKAAKEEHNYEGAELKDGGAAGHYYECQNEGCENTSEPVDHEPLGDVEPDCTKDVVCECGHVISEGEEDHNYEDAAYIPDEDGTGHYQSCQNEGCVGKSNIAPHVPEADDHDCSTPVVCDLCEVELEPGMNHLMGDWIGCEAGHYKECKNEGCDYQSETEQHTPDYDEATEEHGIICTTCQWVIAPPLEHVHSVQDSSIGNPATCTEPGTKTFYTCRCGKWFWDEACTDEGTDRGDITIPALNHEGSADWVQTKYEHHRVCTRDVCDTNNIYDQGEHVDVNRDGFCDVCEYDMSITIEIPITKIVEQTGSDTPGAQTFEFAIEVLNSNAEGMYSIIDSTVVTGAGAGSYEDVLKIRVIWESELYDVICEGLVITEVKGSLSGWTYSDESWHAMAFIPLAEDSGMNWQFAKYVAGTEDVDGDFDYNNPAEVMTFTNAYDMDTLIRPPFNPAPVNPVDPPVNPEDPAVDPEEPAVDPEEPAVEPEEPAAEPEDDEDEAPALDPDHPKTGDESNMMLWLVIMLISALSAGTIAVRTRKED